MQPNATSLSELLNEGQVTQIAKEHDVTVQAVSKALRRGRPGNRHVQRAMELAVASGALATAQKIASLKPAL